jgi:energy-coupling factor transport system ATP-binding protein
MSLLEFKNVGYTYAGSDSPVEALRDVSFSVEEGEFVVLVGHNGSGKSTIARLCNGLITPTKGTVTAFGFNTADADKLFDIRKNVGVVFQNPDNQLIATIIEDDIAFGPENLGLSPSEISERVKWALESVGMADHAKGTPFRLSGGQKQRIAIAGVLAVKPKLMVLDEATAMLDPLGREEVLAVIKRLREEEGMTVVMITHFMEEAFEADKIIALSEGEIKLCGGKEIFLRGGELEQIGLDVPISQRIALSLREKGVKIPEGIYDAQRLVKELCR